MLVFIDTEFTDLREPYLISAGFAAADGRELYFEMSGVSPVVCCPFVQVTVLPLLEGPTLTPMQAAERVSEFLGQYREPVTLFCDAPRYDIELLPPFLPANLHWSLAVPSFESEADEQAYQQALEEAFAGGLRRHHALDDARAARRAWLRR
jgi:hypothetical protein